MGFLELKDSCHRHPTCRHMGGWNLRRPGFLMEFLKKFKNNFVEVCRVSTCECETERNFVTNRQRPKLEPRLRLELFIVQTHWFLKHYSFLSQKVDLPTGGIMVCGNRFVPQCRKLVE